MLTSATTTAKIALPRKTLNTPLAGHHGSTSKCSGQNVLDKIF